MTELGGGFHAEPDHRDSQLHAGEDPARALETTMATAGRATLFSGLTVAIGLALLLVDVLERLDRLFEAETPYMLWIHQRPFDGGAWPGARPVRWRE